MALLKKIRASTLMETLIATVLIMVIFIVSSLILNNLFFNSMRNNTRGITAKINEIEYRYRNGKIKLPFYEDYGSWDIKIEKTDKNELLNISATNTQTSKTLNKSIHKQ